ncbi:Heat shock protein DnaJ [Reticulomyxa filosa]|uniref:Heat shock protein DnaJ n=1 Tax=Reticulomyxa filosa TaxID=46433 RepID=X6M0X2_RETFI|nr:Heat shock protein DnaJ [Reticulomyxa filosa]|eukprot:ETO07514.1 Heat shock protein DnaJ [Reticulomyxa filosa]
MRLVIGSAIQARYFSERIDTTKDYYTILGISRSAPKREIHNAYVKLVKEWHPDVHATKSEQERDIAKQKFHNDVWTRKQNFGIPHRAIQEAHEILENEAARKKYDEMTSNIDMNFGHATGYRQQGHHNREAAWERAFRQQMAAEWEHLRTEQQIHQANNAYAHQSSSFSRQYTRNPLDMFGGPFHFGRYYYGSEASRFLPPLSMSQILVSILVGIVITHFGTTWLNQSRRNNYSNNSRKNPPHVVDDDHALWNELVEDEETNKRSRYSQYPQPSIALSPQHLQSQKLSSVDDGRFSSQMQTDIHDQPKVIFLLH